MASGLKNSEVDKSLIEQLREDQLWGNIRRKAKAHTGLQAELERVIMFYNLIKDNGNKTNKTKSTS
jgi:hypothetical protein